MRTVLLLAVWSLILLAAAHDAVFAWENRRDMPSWELNPIACWLLQGGLECLLVLKFAGLLFAMAVALYCRQRRHVLQLPLTLFVGCLYLFLSLHYYISSVTRHDGPILTASDSAAAGEAN